MFPCDGKKFLFEILDKSFELLVMIDVVDIHIFRWILEFLLEFIFWFFYFSFQILEFLLSLLFLILHVLEFFAQEGILGFVLLDQENNFIFLCFIQ